jgi:tRNA-specific 2-thiouridylase
VRLLRGADPAKDQSYVLYVLGQPVLARTLFPVGHLRKGEVREKAAVLGLDVATKPDSQDACFVLTEGGRPAFLGSRIPLRSGRVVDSETGAEMGTVDAVELVTVGQRRGLGGGGGQRRYALAVDVAARTVTVGLRSATLVDHVELADVRWVGATVASGAPVLAQCSAHGEAAPAVFEGSAVRFAASRPRVAPGQSVVLYRDDEVLGGGVVVA